MFEAPLHQRFTVDTIVLVIYIGSIMWIGLRQSKRARTVEGYTLGNRATPWWAVLTSILAAEISAATFLGAPASGFENRNWVYAQFAIGTILGRIISAYLFIPLFFDRHVISLYEYLEYRFGQQTRLLASLTFLTTRVLAAGTRVFVAAIPLVLVVPLISGQPLTSNGTYFVYALIITTMIAITAVYTAVGGIIAVIWTDAIQLGVLLISVSFILAFLISAMQVGSLYDYIKEPYFFQLIADESSLYNFLLAIFTTDNNVYAAIVGTTFLTLATHGIDQDIVQRMLTAKSKGQSAFALVLSGVIDLPIVCAFIFLGVLLNGFYIQFPDSTLPTDIHGRIDTRMVFPYFILTHLPSGLCGLAIAGVISATMGSLSAALNSLATSYCQDFLFGSNQGELTEESKIKSLRSSTVIFSIIVGAVSITTAFFMTTHPETKIIPLVIGVIGFTYGPLLGVFLLAALTRNRGCDLGNVIAMPMGFVFVLLFSSTELRGFLRISFLGEHVLSFPWRVFLGALVTLGVGYAFPSRKPQNRTS